MITDTERSHPSGGESVGDGSNTRNVSPQAQRLLAVEGGSRRLTFKQNATAVTERVLVACAPDG
jgi:hypothetical protein